MTVGLNPLALAEIVRGSRLAIAREVACDAAATIARAARTAARGPRRSCALAPMLEILRHSAVMLLDRMLPTVPLEAPSSVNADLLDAERSIAVSR